MVNECIKVMNWSFKLKSEPRPQDIFVVFYRRTAWWKKKRRKKEKNKSSHRGAYICTTQRVPIFLNLLIGPDFTMMQWWVITPHCTTGGQFCCTRSFVESYSIRLTIFSWQFWKLATSCLKVDAVMIQQPTESCQVGSLPCLSIFIVSWLSFILSGELEPVI